MNKKRKLSTGRQNLAKSMVMQVRYRPKWQQPKRGKGSYRREKPRTNDVDRGFFMAAVAKFREVSCAKIWRVAVAGVRTVGAVQVENTCF